MSMVKVEEDCIPSVWEHEIFCLKIPIKPSHSSACAGRVKRQYDYNRGCNLAFLFLRSCCKFWLAI